jgi:ubiquinone/menaquinone biosynthesis C-methylase UbiE/uncharacterized protein YbaR (Trm112 family)
MLSDRALALLACPACGGERLSREAFDGSAEALREAVVYCPGCRAWFPVEDGVLDLLTGSLAYREDRERFRSRHAGRMEALGLVPDPPAGASESELQAKQQQHFDWYADNEKQSYLEYERMPFWVAADAIAFSRWRERIRPGSWLLDVGCGPGRATVKVLDLDIDVLGFDVSKAAVRQAEERHRKGGYRARAAFFAADATRFPIRSAVLDYVLVYGVLHHVPDPRAACLEIARVLRPGGTYLGSENNETVFRRVFELLQRLRPLWYEEAGPEALISDRTMREGFAGTGVEIETRSSVYLPPHLLNHLPPAWGRSLLGATDALFNLVPGLRRNGGLILVEGTKRG